MNEYQRKMMDAPSVGGDRCAFCGKRAENRHHIVPRSQGGRKGPTVPVCGFGNTSGCHGKLHSHVIHMDWRDGRWWYLETDRPMKVDDAMMEDAWKML